jgi:tetratricopeptide (TPR) repeat protein
MKRALLTLALLALAAVSYGQVAEGDQHWAARAEGHQGAHAKAAQIDAAINAYRTAVTRDPNDLEARWKLLRALRFKGAYVATSSDEKKAIYTAAKKAGEEAMVIVDARLKAKGVNSVAKATEKQVADAARTIPSAADVFQWDAVNWGEWALVYGKMAAVREGAADRIRREATIANMVDPKMDGGGPARVLGRLHDQTPHVPFITGWASSKEAVKFLEQAYKADPSNKITRVFLAEALVNDSSATARRAVQILREVISSPNDPAWEVESLQAQEDAKALLRKWNAK